MNLGALITIRRNIGKAHSATFLSGGLAVEHYPYPVYCRKCRQQIASDITECPFCGNDITQGSRIPHANGPVRRSWAIPAIISIGAITLIAVVVMVSGRGTSSDVQQKLNPLAAKSNSQRPTRIAPTTSQRPSVHTAPNTSAYPNSQPSTVGQSPLPYEPAPRPVPKPLGEAHIGGAHLVVQNDGQGHEICVGRVLIVNDGPYNIIDYRLGLEVNGLPYVLVPYEGSLDNPMTIYDRHIPPGGSVDCPVSTMGTYASYSKYGMKKVLLTVTLDGPPGTITDECSVM